MSVLNYIKRHLLIIFWTLLLLGLATFNAVATVMFGTRQYYDIIFNISVWVLAGYLPIICIDLRLANRSKLKEREKKIKEKDIEILERDIQILKKDVEIAKLMEQKALTTEEDIILSKEKHICLVHKGPIQGFSFVCPECGSFYCQKCVMALMSIDNECWSCQHQLDAEMPKPDHTSEDDVMIEKEERDFDKQRKRIRVCKECGFTLGHKEKFCPHCGKELR